MYNAFQPIRLLQFVTICLMGCSFGFCTDQAKDVVVIDGQEHIFLESPMRDHGYKLPNFDFERTSNWGGYRPEWEIKEGKLWMTAFHAKLKEKTVEPKELFNKDLPMLATWVNGPMYATKDVIRSEEGLVFGTKTERVFFIDGNVHKRSRHEDKIQFESGLLGIGFGDSAGKLKIDSVERYSAADRMGKIFIGDELISMTDIDDEIFDVSDFSKSKAQQYFRVIPNQLVRFSIRSPMSGKVTEVEMTCDSYQRHEEEKMKSEKNFGPIPMRFDSK